MIPTPFFYKTDEDVLIEDILSSDSWPHFLDVSSPRLVESTVRNLLKGKSCSERVNDPAEAKRFVEDFNSCMASIQSLFNESESLPYTREYANRLVELSSMFMARPSWRAHSMLKRQRRHVDFILDNIGNGRYRDPLAQNLLEKVVEFSRSNMSEGRDAECDADFDTHDSNHNSFVKAINSKFDIKVERQESVREGLYLYLNLEDTNSLNKQLDNYNDYLNEIVNEHGYLLIRRGSESDITFGNFGETHSKWVFVYCPKTDAAQSGVEIISKHDYKPIKL